MTDCLKRLLLIGWNGRMAGWLASWMTGLAIWSDNMCLVIIIFGFMVDDICCMLTSTKSKEEASWQAAAATDRQTDRRLNALAQLKTTPENLATTTIIKNKKKKYKLGVFLSSSIFLDWLFVSSEKTSSLLHRAKSHLWYP